MDSIERQQVRDALDRLKPYLAAYLSQQGIPIQAPLGRSPSKDIQPMLKTMVGAWNERLRERLPKASIAYVHELMDIRTGA